MTVSQASTFLEQNLRLTSDARQSGGQLDEKRPNKRDPYSPPVPLTVPVPGGTRPEALRAGSGQAGPWPTSPPW